MVSTRCKHKVAVGEGCNVQEEEEEEAQSLLPGALLGREKEKAKGLPKELEVKKVEVKAVGKRKLSRWDRHLRKFNYTKALDAALEVAAGEASDG